MEIINKGQLRILKADDGKLLKDKNDNGETLEDGTYIEPYKTDIVYLGVQIKTLEQAKELYEEVDD
nr:MAG TPA: hypothetical protein [Caudoviricetes sp.]